MSKQVKKDYHAIANQKKVYVSALVADKQNLKKGCLIDFKSDTLQQ